MTEILPIPQWYGGIKFRSTLEARWAVFFDAAEIRWGYEPEGYVVSGRPYRPDFLLRDCGTWAEVKGDPARLDIDLMRAAAVELPRMSAVREHGPRLLILGPIPELPEEYGDFGWLGLSPAYPRPVPEGEDPCDVLWWGFGSYAKNRRPWSLENQQAEFRVAEDVAEDCGSPADWLEPVWDPFSFMDPVVRRAYFYARAYRFGR